MPWFVKLQAFLCSYEMEYESYLTFLRLAKPLYPKGRTEGCQARRGTLCLTSLKKEGLGPFVRESPSATESCKGTVCLAGSNPFDLLLQKQE